MAVPTFPTLPGVTWPIARTGPIFDTVVQDAISGKQTAFAKRVTPKWTWELPFDVLRSAGAFAEMQALAGFFASCYGRCFPFGYQDDEDNSASSQAFGVGDGTTTNFRLVRTLGGFVEPVYLPTGAPAIFVNGVATTTFTIGSSGLIIFATAPAAGAVLTWTGTFNWLCRFDDDKIDFSRFTVGRWSVEKLSFTSVIQ